MNSPLTLASFLTKNPFLCSCITSLASISSKLPTENLSFSTKITFLISFFSYTFVLPSLTSSYTTTWSFFSFNSLTGAMSSKLKALINNTLPFLTVTLA
ncbi:hypothetical protein [Tissierella carlieri]|uniref:hypothetical protein n=1 Tax=Tissierella carlieri TaxID=689904 RepID=UPI003867D47E